jgi:adenylosuccinate synthase
MSAVVVVGAQWGDEGKGKVVDHLARGADVVVRFAGGPNAGHTLVVGRERLVVRLVPSGILWPEKTCVLGQGMVIDPELLVRELDELTAAGHLRDGFEARLRVSDRAHAILPHHVLADGLRESSAGPGRAIGTTKRGIGPAYEDKAARRGLMLGALRDLGRAADLVSAALEAWAPFFAARGAQLPKTDAVMRSLRELAPRIVPLLADTSALVADRLAKGERVLLEGAQGTLLDLDHGTYPFVTSSSATAGGACTGAGIGPRAIGRVVGIVKAYATRVGAGPFPTELDDATGERLRAVGGEFGSVTGRPRRTGWLDVAALRYAARVNGLDAMALTKLDVLTGIDPLRVCVGYDTAGGRVRDLPVGLLGTEGALEPVWAELSGWSRPIGECRALEELPREALEYVRFVEREVGVPFDLVSVGPSREATIGVREVFGT